MTSEKLLFRQKDFNAADLPSPETVIPQALDFMTRVTTEWKEGKTYKTDAGPVRTFHNKNGNDYWMARYSAHTDVTYEEFRSGIFENHTKNELGYIELLDSYRPAGGDVPEPWQHFIVHYKFPRLFSDREMAIYISCFEPEAVKKQFLVVTLPSAAATDPNFQRAIYCSLELVTYDESTQSVQWLVAQTSDSRGSIPRWIQEQSVAGMVAQDVPSFIKWAKERRSAQ